MGRECRTYGEEEEEESYMIVVGKPEGKRPLGKRRCEWEENSKMGLREIGRSGMDWIHLAQDRDQCRALVNMVMKFRVPLNVVNS
jgi:hypothetical protein